MRGRLKAWVRLGVLAGALGCDRELAREASPVPIAPAEPSRAPAPAARPDALPVAIHGCAGLTLAPACWRRDEPTPLVLWIEGEPPADGLEVWIDGAPSPDEVEIDADADGSRIELAVPATAEAVEVHHPDGRRFSLAIVPEPPAWAAAAAELDAMRDGGWSLAELRGRLLELRAGLGPPDAQRLDCLDAMLAFEAGDSTLGMQIAWRLDHASTTDADLACVDLIHINAIYASIMRAPDRGRALAHRDALRAHPQDVLAAVYADYLTGELDKRVGRLDESLAWYERAARVARRVGLPQHAEATIQHATALASLGRFDEAKARADEAVAALPPDSPYLPQIRSNAAWVQILRREDEPSLPDPSAELRTLADRFAREDPDRANGVRLNLAIAASQSGDVAAAARALQTVDRRALADTAEQVFWELVSARIAGARAEPARAREHLERARLLAELGSDEALELRARLARAGFELTQGKPALARAELEAAERIEDGIALGIAPSAGRSTFSSARRHDRARHVELLLALGDREAALCTVVAARARHMRSLRTQHARLDPAQLRQQDELLLRHHERREALARRARTSWELPSSELAALRKREAVELEALDELLSEAMSVGEREPPPWRCADVRRSDADEALLTMHPASEPGRWWWLLDRAGAIEVVTSEPEPGSPADSPDATASRALEALAASGRLEGLRTLTVVPIGAMGTVDLHALPRLRDVDVRYSVGLGSATPTPVTPPSVAILVGESQNLREPRAEAAAVGEALRAAGWAVSDAWDPSAEASPTLLHYAGHGHHGGASGWDSHLVLADGALHPKQIIAQGRSPAVVVLGACDAGTQDPGLVDGGMNVATAFLLAGAELVIAPQQGVDDHAARALAEALYLDPPRARAAVELALTLQTRLAAARRRDPRFRQWRAWVP